MLAEEDTLSPSGLNHQMVLEGLQSHHILL